MQRKSKKVKLSFVGDICLAGGLQDKLAENGPDYPFLATHHILQQSDLVIGNLECCIIEPQAVYCPPANIMKVPEYLADGLARSCINVVSLANNHILDDGESGLISTQKFLDKHGIRYFGAGRNLYDAEQALYITVNDVRFAFLGACDVPSVYADIGQSGVASMDSRRLINRITESRRNADIIVVSMHADIEFTPYPAPSRVRLSRWLIENGADFVIQHHPHVCQGVEYYKGGLIGYSLGNFIFYSNGNHYFKNKHGTDWGMILNIDVDILQNEKQFQFSIIPVTIDAENSTIPSAGDYYNEQIQFISIISKNLSSWKVLHHQRMQCCLNEFKNNLYRLYYLWRRKGFLLMLKSSVKLIMDPYERRWMYSLLTWGLFG